MTFTEWLKIEMPNKPDNPHTVFSNTDMQKAYEGGALHGIFLKAAEEAITNGNYEDEPFAKKVLEEETDKKHTAKNTSLIAQIIAAVWVAAWCAKKFFADGGETTDIIFSGFAIAACFSPVYFNMILDKVKNIRFGDN